MAAISLTLDLQGDVVLYHIAGLTPTLIFSAILSTCGTVVMFMAMRVIKICSRH